MTGDLGVGLYFGVYELAALQGCSGQYYRALSCGSIQGIDYWGFASAVVGQSFPMFPQPE